MRRVPDADQPHFVDTVASCTPFLFPCLCLPLLGLCCSLFFLLSAPDPSLRLSPFGSQASQLSGCHRSTWPLLWAPRGHSRRACRPAFGASPDMLRMVSRRRVWATRRRRRRLLRLRQRARRLAALLVHSDGWKWCSCRGERDLNTHGGGDGGCQWRGARKTQNARGRVGGGSGGVW